MHDVIDGNAGNDSWQQGRVVAGRYRLDSPVGSGAMGVVWRAADLRLDRTVAVKQLVTPAGANPEEMPRARQRVFREARIAARLKHPQAVAVYDVTTDDHRQPILVMEYVASQSLADLLVERGALPVEQVARIGADTAAALTAAHEAGIVHRDVKPANILLPENGGTAGPATGSGSYDTIKITDFGLASVTGDVAVNASGRVTGTPAFLAPETARGEPHTPASDVFSLGATLYAALEGEPPFGSVEDAGIQLQRVAYGQPQPPRHAGPLTRPLLAMLNEDPTARPTMSQVAQVLTAVAHNPDSAPSPPTATQQRTPRRRRAAVAVFAALGIGLLGLLAVMLLGNDDTTSAAGAAGPPQAAPPNAPSTPAPPATESAELQRAVTDYYTLLADDPAKAWNLLGPALREQDRAHYEKAWSEVDDIRIRNAPTVSGNTVVAEIEYTVASGDRVRETHQHIMLKQDGTVLINSDDVLSSRVIRDGEAPRRPDGGDHAPDDAIDDPIDDATPAPPPPPGSYDEPDAPSGGPEQGRPGQGGPGPGGPNGGGPKGTSNAKPVKEPGKGDVLET